VKSLKYSHFSCASHKTIMGAY